MLQITFWLKLNVKIVQKYRLDLFSRDDVEDRGENKYVETARFPHPYPTECHGDTSSLGNWTTNSDGKVTAI